MAIRRAKIAPREAPAGLFRETILETTRDLARRHGFAKISMRMLAARLGVSAPALYYHFKNKRELFDEVAALVFEELVAIDTRVPWTQQLRTFVLSYQQRLVEYPGLARVMLGHRDSRAGVLWTETILSILKRGGFNRRNIWPALGALVFFVNPMTLFDEKPRAASQALFDARRVRRAIDRSPNAYPTLGEWLREADEESKGAALTYDGLLPSVLDRIIEHLQQDAKSQR